MESAMKWKTFRKWEQGLTMGELLVILTIIGVMTLVALPDYISTILPKQRLKGATLDIVTDMRLARMRSAASNVEYRLVFVPAAETYVMQRGNRNSSSDTWTTEGPTRNFSNSDNQYYHHGVDLISVSNNPVVFKPTGRMTNTTVRLRNVKGQTMAVTASISGRIRTS